MSLDSSMDFPLSFTENKIGIFRKGDEKINVWIGLILLGLAISEILFFSFSINENFSNFLEQVIFLDAMHVAFTFVALATLPEAKQWLNRSPDFRKSMFTKVAVIWLMTFSLLTYFGLHSKTDAAIMQAFLAAVIILKFALPVWHGIYQVRGLSAAYNYNIRRSVSFSEAALAQAKRLELTEKVSYRVLVGSLVAWFVVALLLPETFSGISQLRSVVLLKYFFWFLMIAAVLTIFFCAYRYPYAGKSNKFFYSLRLALIALFPASQVAQMSSGIFHGSEYLFVFRSMRSNSAISHRDRKQQVKLTVGACFLLLLLGSPAYYVLEKDYTPAMILSVSAGMGIAFAHYYIDRYLFKMRDSHTQNSIGKIFPTLS